MWRNFLRIADIQARSVNRNPWPFKPGAWQIRCPPAVGIAAGILLRPLLFRFYFPPAGTKTARGNNGVGRRGGENAIHVA
jgi:hypothetical protein